MQAFKEFRQGCTIFDVVLELYLSLNLLPKLSIANGSGLNYATIKESYDATGLEAFELFWDNKPVTTLYKAGLLRI